VVLLLPLAFIGAGQAVAAPATPNVNVVNTPTVLVGNTPLPVFDVDNPASQPFQASAQFTMSGIGPVFSVTSDITVVPAGKMLVIEHVTFIGATGSPGKIGASISNSIAGPGRTHWLVLTEQGALFGTPAFMANQPMRLYAGPGTTVRGHAFRSIDSIDASAGAFSISGHFVDIP
jgi:hypothetical protein